MITKDFIEKIANGTFSKNDVLIQSEVFPDKKDLLWDLWMADKACLESTGKPQISDEAQISRISRAIDIISNEYQINIFTDDEKTHKRKAKVHPVNIPDEISNTQFTREYMDNVFYTDKSDESIIKIFNSLKEFGYIHNNSTQQQFLTMCGRGSCAAPIVWNSGVRKLAYFIQIMFGNNNERKWEKTIFWFMIKGKKPVKGSLISGLSEIINKGTSSRQSATYFDNYDKTLRKIVNES